MQLLLIFLFYFLLPVNHSLAQAVNCNGPLVAQVSLDGKTPAANISSVNATRYYLHVTSNGQPCSTRFDIESQFCDVNNVCGAFTIRSPWQSYKSDERGIARIDINENFVSPATPGLYRSRFRPAGSTHPFSNDITVRFLDPATNTDTFSRIVNLSEYYNAKPGHTYMYTTHNNITGGGGKTRIQMEEEIDWCGFRIAPWRFTKDHVNAYHFPWRFTTPLAATNIQDRDLSMRWMILSDQNVFPAPYQNINTILTTMGEKRYNRTNIRDINQSDHYYTIIAGTTTSSLPAYFLGSKPTLKVPSYALINTTKYFFTYHRTQLGLGVTDPLLCPTLGTNYSWHQPDPPTGTWRARFEFENIVIDGSQFDYNGEALRMDIWEKPYPQTMNEGLVLRETWYFVKNIGLVRIEQKQFNPETSDPNPTYWGLQPSFATQCLEDTDCRRDTIQSPHIRADLDAYFHNPALTTSVSLDGATYSNQITTTPEKGYFLGNANGFTGYLEVLSLNNIPTKWFWSDGGVTWIDPSSLAGIPVGTYTRRHRIWVPNDAYAGESRVTDTTVPWSNETTVNIVKNGDFNGDGVINLPDYSQLRNVIGKTGIRLEDVDNNSRMNIFDYNWLVTFYKT